MHLYRINDKPTPFKMVAPGHHEAIMEWLAGKEDGGPTWLPSVFLVVSCIDDEAKTIITLIPWQLRARDRERQRCGLPPFWEDLARELEVNAKQNIRELARKIEGREEAEA